MYPGFRRPWENYSAPLASLILLALAWFSIVLFLNRPSSVEGEASAEFAYERFAVSSVLRLLVAEEYPDWLMEWSGSDEESIREEAVEYFDTSLAGGYLPERALPHWGLFLDRVGEAERARSALERMEASDPEALLQKEVVETILAGTEPESDLEAWVRERYREGTSELPEWTLLGGQLEEEAVLDWMKGRGHRILRRGMVADALVLLVIGAAAVAAVLLLVWRKALSRALPFARIESRGWTVRVLLREFFVAELIGFAAALAIGSWFSILGASQLGWIMSGFAFMVLPPAWLSWRMTPGFRASLRLFRIRKPSRPVSHLLVVSFVGAGMLLLGVFLLKLTDREGALLVDSISADELDYWNAILWSFFLSVVLAPTCEEWVFRGFLFGGLRHRWGAWPAAFVSTGIFALLHGYTLAGLGVVFVYGLIFCWLYQRSGSLVPGMIAHAVFNLVATAQMVGWFSLH